MSVQPMVTPAHVQVLQNPENAPLPARSSRIEIQPTAVGGRYVRSAGSASDRSTFDPSHTPDGVRRPAIRAMRPHSSGQHIACMISQQ
jgi:hypothetical protein